MIKPGTVYNQRVPQLQGVSPSSCLLVAYGAPRAKCRNRSLGWDCYSISLTKLILKALKTFLPCFEVITQQSQVDFCAGAAGATERH